MSALTYQITSGIVKGRRKLYQLQHSLLFIVTIDDSFACMNEHLALQGWPCKLAMLLHFTESY
jgi:hypothetical protein